MALSVPGIHPSRVARTSGSCFTYVNIPKVPIVTAPKVINVPDPRLFSLFGGAVEYLGPVNLDVSLISLHSLPSGSHLTRARDSWYLAVKYNLEQPCFLTRVRPLHGNFNPIRNIFRGGRSDCRVGEKGNDGAKQLVAGPPSPIFRIPDGRNKDVACGERGAARNCSKSDEY